jgi:hypothetical protein
MGGSKVLGFDKHHDDQVTADGVSAFRIITPNL